MNYGIATSFIIGGLLLLSILILNNQISRFGISSTSDMLNKERMEVVTEMLINDFQKIGYNIPQGMSPFVIVQEQRIKFRADTFFDDNRPFSMVTWEFNDNKAYTDSKNPSDYELTRVDNASQGSGNAEFVIPATHFKIEYLDQAGNIINNPAAEKYKIRQIRVELICESLEPSGTNEEGEEIYTRSVWSKTFHPENLQFLNQ